MFNPTDSSNDRQFAVEVEGVNHHYGKTHALKNVSLKIERGQTVGLIGPDGVGKSTLLSLIAGVKVLQSGHITVLSNDVAKRREREDNAYKVAFMPQGLGKNLYPTLSIKENIEFHANLYGLGRREREEKIARLLKATALDPFPDRPAGKLSGGMKQKLSLCCALINDPELLILDEPTTGVDPLSRRQFWDLVEELRTEFEGMTVIVSTAYIEEAEQFDYLLAMNAGELLAADPTTKVLKDTNSKTLEEAYVRLLPKRDHYFDFDNIPPFEPIPNEAPAIKAENLSKKFGNFTAVDNVSFEIPRGEIFGFLGSNGCGKSTTMKMLTGLLEPSSGSAELLGQATDANDIKTRLRVGYMSQSFSLYEELSVRANLELHAKLYQLGDKAGDDAVEESLQKFKIKEYEDELPPALSLGLRQRLQLAAACLHKPEVLILDEPTSGVDPAARDMFWDYLINLSRHDRITIFVSTHFMNEAGWCDRISFMHQGKVLAQDKPQELVKAQNAANLEEAFIAYLEQAEAEDNADTEASRRELDIERPTSESADPTNSEDASTNIDISNASSSNKRREANKHSANSLNNILAFAARENKELLRDPVRLVFVLFGPVILVFFSALGITFDVRNIGYAIYDQDQSQISRELTSQFSSSPYFKELAILHSDEDFEQIIKTGKIRLVVEIPPDFGRQLLLQRKPELSFYVDGSMPFTGENIKGYILGIMTEYSQDLAQRKGYGPGPAGQLQTRFVYNQDFNSISSITPGMMMMAMVLIPAMMTALGVVREREIGSIMNLYGSPATVMQFLIGKQIPYIFMALLSFYILTLISVLILQVPVTGSFSALFFGAFCIAWAATSLGLLVSCFATSQVAAIFGSAILAMIPSLNFSGLLTPVSSLEGANALISQFFPSSWFHKIVIGAFAKGLSWTDFINYYVILAAFAISYLLLANIFLKKQET
ncbi:MAG: ribosome-associated ATPase/putative transporter RbbA [Alcaligenaceae bacterium]|nr:ribosome-associated ATPase/putative transporter RbbA [Alcaligenaceae bacterium]